jgi:hypothetical protein
MGYVSVPVLEGYAINAANIRGQQVRVYKKDDNTYALVGGLDLKPTDTIQYSIVPNDTRKVKSAPGGMWLSPQDGEEQASRVNYPALARTIKENIHIRPDADGATVNNALKPDEFVQYMQKNFRYSYAPLPEDKLAKQKDMAGIIDLALTEKRANCNVAATLMMLNDPTDKSPVFEFNNQGADNIRTLVGKEAHARVVDIKGTVYDPTPTLQAVIKPEKRDKPAPIPIGPLTAATVGLAASVIALKRREQIAQAAKATASAAAERTVGDIAREAIAVTDQAMWSGEGAVIDAKHITESQKTINMPVRDALAALRQPERSDTAMQTYLRTQPAVRRVVRGLIRVLSPRS